MAEAPAKKERKERKERAIIVGLVDALRMVEQIHLQGGGVPVPKNTLEHILDSKPKSSFYDRKLAALRSYGLIDTRNDVVTLTPLAEGYAMPVSAEQKSQIALQAFRKISLFDKILNQYDGKSLPNIDQFFYNLIATTYGLPYEEVPKWLKEFVEGARHTGVLVSEGGREIVRLSSSVGASPAVPAAAPKQGASTMTVQEAQTSTEMVNLQILGGQMTMNVPEDIEAEDLKNTIGATEDALELLLRKWFRLTGKKWGEPNNN